MHISASYECHPASSVIPFSSAVILSEASETSAVERSRENSVLGRDP